MVFKLTDYLDKRNKPKRGLVDEPGSYSGDPKFNPEMTLPELKAAGIKSKNKYKLEGKYGKTGYAYVAPQYDKAGNRTGKYKSMVFPTDAAREKFIKDRKKMGKESVAKSFDKVTSKRNIVQKNVNNWIKDWFNKNNKKFKIGQYDEAMSKLKEDWAKESTKNKYKTEGLKGRILTSSKGFPVFKDIKLEGMTGTDPARSGLERPLALGRTMDTTEPFYKKSFHNFILKNDPKLRKDIKSFMTWATKDKRGLGKQTLLLEASQDWLKNDNAVKFMGEVDDLVLDKLKRGELLRKYFPKTTDSYMNKIYKIDNFRNQTIAQLEKLAGVEPGYVNYNLRKDRRDLRKIFNTDKLPLALKYSGDHIVGLKEASVLKDKVVAKQVIDNVVGKTFQQNIELGGTRFGRQRRDLTKEFVNKKTTLTRKNEIVNLLNEASEKYMPGEIKYNLGKKNNLVITPLKIQSKQSDRFTSYFEEIYKTPQGKKQIIKQAGGLKQIIAKLSPNSTCAVRLKKSEGGGVSGLDECFREGMQAIKEKNINKPHQIQGAKQLMNAGKRIGASTFARRLLDLGILGEVAFIAGDTGIRMAMGRPFNEAFKAATFRETSADLDRQKRAGFTEREMLISKAGDLENKANSIQQQIDAAEDIGDDVSVGPLQDRLKKIEQELNSPIDNKGTKLQNLLLPTNPTNIEATRKLENVIDSDRAKSIYSAGQLKGQLMGDPEIVDDVETEAVTMRTPTIERQALPSSEEYLREFMRQNLPKSEDESEKLEDKDIDRFVKTLSPMEKFQLEALDQSRAERLYGTQGKFREGGLANLTTTVAPQSGPNSKGLESLRKYATKTY